MGLVDVACRVLSFACLALAYVYLILHVVSGKHSTPTGIERHTHSTLQVMDAARLIAKQSAHNVMLRN